MNDQNSIVYVRVPGKRPPGFQDPVPFEWNVEKETQLWQFLFKLDNSIDQIDWDDLSEILNAPVYFIKRRSYKLFTKQVDSMRKQIENKRKILSRDKLSPSGDEQEGKDEAAKEDDIKNDDTKKNDIKQEHIKENPENDQKVMDDFQMTPLKTLRNAKNSFKHSPYKSSDESISDDSASMGADSNFEALKHLRSSKILHMKPNSLVGNYKVNSNSNSNSESKEVIHKKMSPLERQLERLNTQNSDSTSDISSSLSVSKSALEEALMDRLRF